MQSHINRAVRRDSGYRGLFEEEEYTRVADFYRAHPELGATPLVALPELATDLSIGELLVKDETARFGLEAFKIAGARYAIHCLGPTLRGGIVCATAGNHGRAVARAARESGLACTVFLPALNPRATALEQRTRASRIAGMRQDGAETVDVDGSYEEAVARAADHARHSGSTIVSDTAWTGYEAIPRLIMTGYTRLFDEALDRWHRVPDVVLIQGGVGGLVCAAANWFAHQFGPRRPILIACEPDSAACLLESARAGMMIDLGTRERTDRRAPTMMAGLRCAEPSPAAWPSIQLGIDGFVSIPDSLAVDAMERLSHPRANDPVIVSGPSGACGVGALLAIATAPELAEIRDMCGLDRSTHGMAIVTEGA